ncbi:hypothetical protein ILYODFUR_015628 [Ilyodon furcidens]|uniref:Bifunctional inhibitor/plant lipid transfer protein/seed storage helical domain-containing protein n=1 Tax=Ilyodon furcidens TaxID=33524 RepID=A0ABV0UKG3_9TELE
MHLSLSFEYTAKRLSVSLGCNSPNAPMSAFKDPCCASIQTVKPFPFMCPVFTCEKQTGAPQPRRRGSKCLNFTATLAISRALILAAICESTSSIVPAGDKCIFDVLGSSDL